MNWETEADLKKDLIQYISARKTENCTCVFFIDKQEVKDKPMRQPAIKPVESNKSKGKTYTYLMSNYKSAMENGYYGEAELIVYAFIEDRLRAFLYYSDAVNTRKSQNINEAMVSVYGRETSIKNISDKIEVIKTALDSTCKETFKSNEYAQCIFRTMRSSFTVDLITCHGKTDQPSRTNRSFVSQR